METIDWQNVTAAVLAMIIFVGGLFMMFTNFWTTSLKSKKND